MVEAAKVLLTVEAPDSTSAMVLVQRLVGVVGGEAVSFSRDRSEVTVESHEEPAGSLVEALNALASWLVDLELEQARVRLDGRSWTMPRPAAANASSDYRAAHSSNLSGRR